MLQKRMKTPPPLSRHACFGKRKTMQKELLSGKDEKGQILYRMMPQAPIRSCEMPVHTTAPLEWVPREKNSSTNRAFERAAESARM